jgi:fructosamine-3-kinase
MPDMSRRDIHYWKCDRPAAFHGTRPRNEPSHELQEQLHQALQDHLGTPVTLHPASGQGNHLTYFADTVEAAMFIRVENGPEQDAHLSVESRVLDLVRAAGVPTPRVLACDAGRSRLPFAWQALERIPFPDLNHWHKQGLLNASTIAFDIGASVARWQTIRSPGFGILDDGLRGFHPAYADYFYLRLDEHLGFLVEHRFLSPDQRGEILREIAGHETLLNISQGCLVHKDLALWNILGDPDHIAAFIDFDDAISGDPMDDLSLLACFHDAAFLHRAFEGYESQRPLPEEHLRRFWLHLLRNMIIKSVIRVGAGYFDRDDGFFLIGSGSSGSRLRETTLSRLSLALRGLREASTPAILSP